MKTELLVRHLRTWAEGALGRARRVTYVHGFADADGGAAAEAAVRVLADLPDLARGRELSMVAVGQDMTEVGKRLTATQRERGMTAGLAVLPVGGGTDERLPVVLKAAGALHVPLLGYLDASAASEPPAVTTVRAITAGKPAEVLLVLPPGGSVDPYRGLGFPLVTAVELANGEVMALATGSAKSLEGFKEALWVADPERLPDDAALQRDLLEHLAAGPATVTGLRTFALTATVYRAADATRVLHALVDEGAVTRVPAEGRLGGDVTISL
ncbi:hypothetical protein [Actinoplanes derwentensis]|uniref:hypothetical protein n=1 Tax=Actinoplanes derwentensis TaxID=113562 RepID=UPI001E64786F|nr:hypothetical protein [Actinoplanes derwentensis]